MKKISLALLAFLIVVGICIPAVSAEEVTISFTDEFFDSDYYTPSTDHMSYAPTWRYLRFDNIQNYYLVKSITVDINTPTHVQYSVTDSTKGYASTLCDYKIGGVKVGHGRVYYNVNAVNDHLLLTAEFYDTSGFSNFAGSQMVQIVPDDNLNGLTFLNYGDGAQVPSGKVLFYINVPSYLYGGIRGDYYTISEGYFRNDVTFTDTSAGIDVTLTRQFEGTPYPSNANIYTDIRQYYSFSETTDVSLKTYELPVYINLTTIYGKKFSYIYGGASSTINPTVTIYVRNSQTGAAIANSRIVIDALVDGDYLPVINRTEPSGIFSVTLQPTGGGLPNPDGYRLIASADGYINPLPEINFTVDQYTTSIYCYLDPIAGGPLDENKTFIDFFVRDMSANPISGATVNFGGYTMITNSAGYAVLEVGKNATYTYTVSKLGYGSLTGNVVIGDDPRHTINTVLAPAVTPTTTTPIPTDTPIGPTPTLTAPTGEPTSNLLEWFAAHFGMILGGGVEIGKIFMWLCFTVPVGVYVGKEAKAGAAGFMAGAGIVTLFFVLIGWVPIWLVVLIALIIGLLYAKVFNTPDNGGGR